MCHFLQNVTSDLISDSVGQAAFGPWGEHTSTLDWYAFSSYYDEATLTLLLALKHIWNIWLSGLVLHFGVNGGVSAFVISPRHTRVL